MKLIIVTPKEELINDEFDYVLAKADKGEIGFMKDRLPIILKISNGYVVGTKSNIDHYAFVSNGILDNKDNVITIVCEEACLGSSVEDAKAKLEAQRAERRKSNREKTFDFVQAEKDLAKAIKETKASKL